MGSACSSQRAVRATPFSNEIRFKVRSSVDFKPLPGVEASLVGRKGIRVVGRTNEQGFIGIPKSDLEHEQVLVIMFCHASFFCGAMPVSSDTTDYDGLLLTLAPFAIP